jgi:hypothetical protein
MGIILFVSISTIWILSDFLKGGIDEIDELVRKTKDNNRDSKLHDRV